MRINKFVAESTGMSRRQADDAIAANRVKIDGTPASLGSQVPDGATVSLDSKAISPKSYEYVLLNKPIGYVSSRKAQDEKPTIYELLPEKFHHLKPAGRLDADSRGLILLTNDGQFAHEMMHPSNAKLKRYRVLLDKPLSDADKTAIESGLLLDDGESQLSVESTDSEVLLVTMQEGRNRQIRRTFAALEYTVTDLQRTHLGDFSIDGIEEGAFSKVDRKKIPPEKQ